MTSDQAKNLTLVTALVLAAGATIENEVMNGTLLAKAGSPGQSVGGAAKKVGQIPGNQFKLFPRLFMIGLSMLVLALMADQVPEVAGPLALLILVAYVFHEAQYFKDLYESVAKG
jgi:hypothetical protein